jgi:signal transduction histidine kinase
MTGSWSLRTRFILVTLVSLLPILGVVSYIVYQSLQNNLDQLIDTETFSSDTVAQGLESTFEDNLSVLNNLATNDVVRATASETNGAVPPNVVASSQSKTAAKQLFQEVQTYRRNITALFMTDQQGQIILWEGNPNNPDFQAQVNDTIARTSTTSASAVSGSLTSPSDSAGFIALTSPIFAPNQTSGEIRGVAGAILTVDPLRQTFTPFARGDTIIMVVADRQIVTTSAPDTERSSLLNAFLNADGTTGQVFRYQGAGNVDRVAVSTTVDIGDSAPWTVIVSNPTPITYGPTQQLLQRGIAGTILAVLLTILLTLILANRTARPLDRLTQQVTSMSAGDLPARDQPPVELHGGREVRKLGLAFQEMARRLASQVDELATSTQMREEQADRLRDLNRRNIRAQEEERRRIAGDIHDAVSPLITGALYQTRALLLDTSAPDPERQRTGLNDIGGLLANASDELHGVIFDLRPPDLDDLGVVAAIERYIANFNRGGMGAPNITVVGQEPTGLTPEIRVTVYRIVQEALHNVVRHSGADEAVVALETIDGQFQVMIRDNGAGFDPEQAKRPTSLGLLSMRERASAIGATLHIESTPGLGTAVVLDRRMATPVTGRRAQRRPRPLRTEMPQRPPGAANSPDRLQTAANVRPIRDAGLEATGTDGTTSQSDLRSTRLLDRLTRAR